MPEDQKQNRKVVKKPHAEQTNAAETAAPAPAPQPAEAKHLEGYLSEVVELSTKRTGIYGEIKQAMCKILEGKDKGRVIRRNVAGRIRVGDILRLPDTTREDKPIRAR